MGKNRPGENTLTVINGDSVWRIGAWVYLSRDSNVLTQRTINPPVGDNESGLWLSCGLALIGMHESNPTP
jgi:hypothetical protein